MEARTVTIRERETPEIDANTDLITRIYTARHGEGPVKVDYAMTNLEHYNTLSNIDTAVRLIVNAIQQDEKILIIGDFDVDGATSCALGVRTLKSFGVKHVDYLVPNRFEFGYGLTPELVQVACENKPDLIITVDNGIANHAGVEYAREQGIKVVITDHHLPAETLPPADAIVNPNLPSDRFASKNLAGVGVIFYLCLALRQALRDTGWFARQGIVEPNMANALDLVALGTVADLVKLDYNNRILVSQGLERVRGGVACCGIRALLDIAGRSTHNITASDFAFALGPRINAAGRMDDMTVGIECLLSDDYAEAYRLAERLNQLNLERREVEFQMREQAERIVSQLMDQREDNSIPDAVCLFDPGWHQGVIGIVASRIKEYYHRPVIVFAHADDHSLKGSARSIKGLNIRDALALVNTENPGLITAFGGHAMAAGLSLPLQHFAEFATKFQAAVSRMVSQDDLQQVIYTDGKLQDTELTLDTAELLFRSGPWGQGFPEPLFDGEFKVADTQILQEKHVKFQLQSGADGKPLNAIAFNVDGPDRYRDIDKVRIVYRLAVNEFRGIRSAQLMIEHIQ